MTYPDTPGFQKNSDTSRAAANALTSQHSMEDDIFRYLEHYASGFTADELHEALLDKHPGVQAGTIAARLRGLELKGRIRKTKETRLTRNRRQAQVWKHPRHVSESELIPATAVNQRTVKEMVRESIEIAEVMAERDKYRRALEMCLGRSYSTIIGIISTTLERN